MLEEYRYIEQKRLRCGYTTGSCAAAAAIAGAQMLLEGREIRRINLKTPKGIILTLPIEDITRTKTYVNCAVQKDAGDDPDITNGILVYAKVECIPKGIVICGGDGVGIITKPGLDQPIGEAAINSVPRRMITEGVEEVMELFSYDNGIKITISVPEGKEIAKKTFNPRLGIEGGISILGTSGIVEPMSEAALLETIAIELKQRRAEGKKSVLLAPGNYGLEFVKKFHLPNPEQCVKCSNFIGQTLDKACELGFQRILLVGHIGKLVKLGAGIMNTHSKMADARMEILACCVLLSGGDAALAKQILSCTVTEEALQILWENAQMPNVMEVLMGRIEKHLLHRLAGQAKIGVIVFSNIYGVLGKTRDAEELLEIVRGE
ncbi:MAG: cobalamin biosynthesis protein CbiD [Lachnospiraceae bacterium]|nr:cobalamin biosynthesis protein CbiD [Lachnospiraceae bacterium]